MQASGQFIRKESVKLALGLNTVALLSTSYGDLHSDQNAKVAGIAIGLIAIRSDMRGENSQETRFSGHDTSINNIHDRLDRLEQ